MNEFVIAERYASIPTMRRWLAFTGMAALALTPLAYPPAGGYAVATLLGWAVLTAVHVGQKDRRGR